MCGRGGRAARYRQEPHRERGRDAARSRGRGFLASCESHTHDVPFHVVARLLRRVFGVSDLDEDAGRAQVRARIPDADPEDLRCWTTYSESETQHPAAPNHRRCPPATVGGLTERRRPGADAPALYVIEDVHWIDEVSEAMLAEFVTAVPRSHSLVLMTYRPEYRGALSRTPGAHTDLPGAAELVADRGVDRRAAWE